MVSFYLLLSSVFPRLISAVEHWMSTNRKKNLLSSNMSSRRLHNMVNFGLLTAEICWRVWGTPANFNGFRVLPAYCTASSSGRQPDFAALNRGRHLCSAGRPSRWALAHVLVLSSFCLSIFFLAYSQGRTLDVYYTSTCGL